MTKIIKNKLHIFISSLQSVSSASVQSSPSNTYYNNVERQYFNDFIYLCNVLTEFHSSISKQNLIVELKNKTINRNKLNGTTQLLASVLLDIVSKI